jgi:hypothetical protein
VIGKWRKLHNEELCNFCSSLRLIRMIKSRRVKCLGHVARMDNRNKNRLLDRKGKKKETSRKEKT